jgi:hypothetical protein
MNQLNPCSRSRGKRQSSRTGRNTRVDTTIRFTEHLFHERKLDYGRINVKDGKPRAPLWSQCWRNSGGYSTWRANLRPTDHRKDVPEFQHSREWGTTSERRERLSRRANPSGRHAEAAEQALREARDINHDLASTRFAKWKQLRAENEKLRELLREITHALKLSFAGKNVRCADELISRAEALSPSPTPAPGAWLNDTGQKMSFGSVYGWVSA